MAVRGAKQPIRLTANRTPTNCRVPFSPSFFVDRRRISASVIGSTVPKSVSHRRQRMAIDLIVSPQTGHFFVSPQAESGCEVAGPLDSAGACSQP